MNYFQTEHFTDSDYVVMRGLYHRALEKNLDLQRYCNTLERRLTVQEIVDNRATKIKNAI